MKNYRLLFLMPLLFCSLQCTSYPRICPVTDLVDHSVETEDGWKLNVSRLVPEKQMPGQDRNIPVILCHSLRVNDNIWILDETHSLARFLSNKGFDVWMFSFRGFGKSMAGKADQKFEPNTNGKGKIVFEDLARKDLTAVVDMVRKETGKGKIGLIGHGFGANACAYYASLNEGENVAFLVELAPCVQNLYKSDVMSSVGTSRCPLASPGNEDIKIIARSIAYDDMYYPSDDMYMRVMFYNAGNIDKSMMYKLHAFALEDTPQGLVDAYKDLVSNGLLTAGNDKTAVVEGIEKISVPVLVITGMADNFAPPESGRRLYERLSAEKKDYIELSKINGCQDDYGHLDMIIGRYADKEVYPHILKWIESRDREL